MAVLFSCFIIVSEADHDCCGEGCPTCEFVMHFQKMMSQLGNGAAVTGAAAIAFCFVSLIASASQERSIIRTPVSAKVRLND